MKTKSYVPHLLVAAFTLSGCATNTLAPNRVESLRLDTQVEAPDTAYYRGGASNFKGDGLLGALVATADDDDSAVLTKLLRKEKIDFPSIFYTQFSERLKNSSLGSKLQETGVLRMQLKIEGYGLGKGWGMSNNMRPSATVHVEIIDGKNAILWKKDAMVGGVTTELAIHTLTEWAHKPDELRDAYVQAANMLANQILNGL
jgi:hypothetical protein